MDLKHGQLYTVTVWEESYKYLALIENDDHYDIEVRIVGEGPGPDCDFSIKLTRDPSWYDIRVNVVNPLRLPRRFRKKISRIFLHPELPPPPPPPDLVPPHLVWQRFLGQKVLVEWWEDERYEVSMIASGWLARRRLFGPPLFPQEVPGANAVRLQTGIPLNVYEMGSGKNFYK